MAKSANIYYSVPLFIVARTSSFQPLSIDLLIYKKRKEKNCPEILENQSTAETNQAWLQNVSTNLNVRTPVQPTN